MGQGNIAVKGMTCQHCVNRVTKAIEELDGVEDVVVSLEAEKAGVTFDETKLNLDRIIKAIGDAGYLTTDITP